MNENQRQPDKSADQSPPLQSHTQPSADLPFSAGTPQRWAEERQDTGGHDLSRQPAPNAYRPSYSGEFAAGAAGDAPAGQYGPGTQTGRDYLRQNAVPPHGYDPYHPLHRGAAGYVQQPGGYTQPAPPADPSAYPDSPGYPAAAPSAGQADAGYQVRPGAYGGQPVPPVSAPYPLPAYPPAYQGYVPGAPSVPAPVKPRDPLRRFANHTGIVLIIQNAAMFALFLFAMFAVVFGEMLITGNNGWESILDDSNGLGMQIITLIVYVLSFVLPFFVYLRLRKVKLSTLASYKKPDIGLGFMLFPLGITLNMAGGYFSNLIIYGLNQIGYDVPSASASDIPYDIAAYAVYFLCVVILAPLIEESIFRGIIMGGAGRFGAAFAVLFSSLVFSLMHGTIEQIPATFLLGLVIGCAVILSDSVWTGIFIHFLNNLVAVGFSTIYEFLPNQTCILIDNIFTILMVVLAIISVIYMFTSVRFKQRLKDNLKGKIKAPVMKKALLAPGMIAFYLMMLAMILMSIEKM